MTVRIGIIGYGKIAVDAHVPAIAATPGLTWTAAVSRSIAPIDGIATFSDHREMLAAGVIDAVAVSTPTQFHYSITRDCLDAGLPVLLEKPPTATTAAFDALVAHAAARHGLLFAAWHSRFAAGVEAARAVLAGRSVTALDIDWHEDVRRWHPGQQWIWAPGGLGVFDPGVNAFSIATHIVPQPLILDEAELDFPVGRDAPIAARLKWEGLAGGVSLDWRPAPADIGWTIRVTTDRGEILLSDGGAKLSVDGADVAVTPLPEYHGVYRRFAALLDSRTTDADAAPLRLAADAFLIGKRIEVAAFVD